MEKIITNLLKTIWNVYVLTGTYYIVFCLGYSGWWFLLALVLLANYSSYTLDDLRKLLKESNK